MGSTQGFFSTPTFELFRRGLQTQTIQRFRGLNAFTPLTNLTPEWASDLLNVIVSGNGQLSKLRLPITLSIVVGNYLTGPNSFWDFQKADGTRQVFANFQQQFYYFQKDFTLTNFVPLAFYPSGLDPANAGQWSFVTADNILFGGNGVRMVKWAFAKWRNIAPPQQLLAIWGITAPPFAPTLSAAIPGNLSPSQGGYKYAFAWKNSVTGHCGNISPATAATGNGANQQFPVAVPANDLFGGSPILAGIATQDVQVDTVVWFRTLDGGGDLFRLCEIDLPTQTVTTLNSGTSVAITSTYAINDNTPDSALDQTTRGPLINNVPLVGRYVALGQGRVFIGNLIGAPQDIIYSGYEQILFGRPEESFPPSNRLRLSIGADTVAGIGVIQAGLVAFSNTSRMYMLRGAVQDVVVTAPINFTSFLEELPWTMGCFSHFTIQATPYGLIWLAGDKTVQLFTGNGAPVDLSQTVYPILQQITPGTEGTAVAAYFNWLERDWYALCCAVNGSQSNNRIIFFALDAKTQDIEVFVSDIPADFIGVITTTKLQRILCISQGGLIKQLPVSSDTIGGITQDLTIIPQQPNSNLHAYWRSGGFGNDSPQRSRMFRFVKLISDQDAKSFEVTARLVDDEVRLITMPEIFGPMQFKGPRAGINRRARRMFLEIDFPQQDVSANVLQLQVARIDTADR